MSTTKDIYWFFIFQINSDFDRLHPDKGVKLFAKWQIFYDYLFELCERNIKDSSSADILENAKTENEARNCVALTYFYRLKMKFRFSDVRFIFQLMSLPFLIPPKGRSIINKSHWKYSIQEVIQGSIVQAKVIFFIWKNSR